VTPKLAQDQKAPDLRAMLKGVTAKNWPQRRKTFTAGLTKALDGKLAQDATLEDVVGFIDALESANGGPEQADLEDDPLPVEDPAAAAEVPGEEDADDAEEFEGKETPEEEILEYLSTVLSPEQLAHVREIATKAGQGGGEKPPAEKPPEAADPPANPEQDPTKDEDPDDKDADMNTKPPAPVDRAAMDQAITAAVKAERVRAAALREAEKVVRPWIGDIAIAQDSAEAVYRLALDSLGLKDKIEGVHPSAWRTILELQPKPSERRPAHTRVAMDAATAKDFAERYPHANRLKQI